MSHPHPSQLTLSKADEGIELTHEEFLHADFAEPGRYERVNGRLVVMSPASDDHRNLVEPLRDALVDYKLRHRDLVEKVQQEGWVIIDQNTERLPDLTVYLQSEEEQPPVPQRIPELIFEIVSPAARDRRRDYEAKRADYQQIGVLEYLIVDRFERRVVVLQLQDGQYTETELGQNDIYTTPLLPGLEIPLAVIFPEEDNAT